MAELDPSVDDGLFAAEERKRQQAEEQARLNAEQQYQPTSQAAPAQDYNPDTAIYSTVAAQAGYQVVDEWGGNDPGQAAPPDAGQDYGGDVGWPQEDTNPWAGAPHEQADEYGGDPFRNYLAEQSAYPYELEQGSNRNYDLVNEGRFENEIDPFRNYTSPEGISYQWDPAARRQDLPDTLDFENPALAPYKDPNTYAAWAQEQRNVRYTEAVQNNVDEALRRPIQAADTARARYNNEWGRVADQLEQDTQRGNYTSDNSAFVNAEDQRRQQQYLHAPWQAFDNTPAGQRNTGSNRFADLVAAYQLEQRNRSGKDRTFGADNGLTPEDFNLIIGAAADGRNQSVWQQRWDENHGNIGSSGRPSLGGMVGDTPRPTPWGTTAAESALGLVDTAGKVITSPDRLYNHILGRDPQAAGPAQVALNVFGAPAAAVKYLIVADLLGGSTSSYEAMALFPGANVQADPTFQALTNPQDKFNYIKNYLAQNQDVEMKLDIMTAPIDFGAWGDMAVRGIGRLGSRTAGLVDTGIVADRAAGRIAIDYGGIGATRPPVSEPFPHEALNGLGVPEVRQPTPRLESRFLPQSDYPMVDVPEQPRPPLAYGPESAPSVPSRATTGPSRAIPEIPGVTTGREYATRVANEGMPPRREIPESAWGEGEPAIDLEGESRFDLEGELPDHQYGDQPLQGQKSTFKVKEPPKRSVPEPRKVPEKPSVAQADDHAGIMDDTWEPPGSPTRGPASDELGDIWGDGSAYTDHGGPGDRPNPKPVLNAPLGDPPKKPVGRLHSDMSGLDSEIKAIKGDLVRQLRDDKVPLSFQGASNRFTVRAVDDFVDAVKNDDKVRIRRGLDQLPPDTVRDLLGVLEDHGYTHTAFDVPYRLGPVEDRVAIERRNALAGPTRNQLEGAEAYKSISARERQVAEGGGIPEQRAAFRDSAKDPYLEPRAVDIRHKSYEMSKLEGRPTEGKESGFTRYLADPKRDPNYKGTFVGDNYEKPLRKDVPVKNTRRSKKVAWDSEGVPWKKDGAFETTKERVSRLTRTEYPTHQDVSFALKGAKSRYEELVASTRPKVLRALRERAEELGVWRGGSFENGGSWKSGLIKEMDDLINEAKASGEWGDFRQMVEGKKALTDERKIFKDGFQERVDALNEAGRDYNALQETYDRFDLEPGRVYDPEITDNIPWDEERGPGLAVTDRLESVTGRGDAPLTGARERANVRRVEATEPGILHVQGKGEGPSGPRGQGVSKVPYGQAPVVPRRRPLLDKLFGSDAFQKADLSDFKAAAVKRVGEAAKEDAKVMATRGRSTEPLAPREGPPVPQHKRVDQVQDWLKKNGGNFAVASSGVSGTQVSEDDPNRGLKIAAFAALGLGGVGVAAHMRYTNKIVKEAESYLPGRVGSKGLTPAQQKFVRLDTQRGFVANAVGQDIRDRLVAGTTRGGALNPWKSKIDYARTVKALQEYVDTGKFKGMVASVTDRAILRDKQVQNALQLVAKDFKDKIPQFLSDNGLASIPGINFDEAVQRRVTAYIDNAMKEHIGTSVRGPIVAGSEAINRATAELVLKYSPNFAMKNIKDGYIQTGIAKSLGQADFNVAGKDIKQVRVAMDQAYSGANRPLWIDQQIAEQVAPRVKPPGGKETIGTFVDRYNPILKVTEGREVGAKRSIFDTHFDNYLTTAVARETGQEARKFSILGNPWSNPVNEVPKGRLSHLPADVRKDLLSAKSLPEARAILNAPGVTMRDYKNGVDMFSTHLRDARVYADFETSVQMRNYAERNNLDTALSVVYPFHFWTTRGAVWTTHMAGKHPLAALGVAAASLYIMHENKGIPLKDRLGINIPVGWLINQVPFDPKFKEQVQQGLDWYMNTHNRDQDLHIGLMNWAAGPAMNAIKGMDPQNLRNMLDITHPANMALAVERLMGWKGRSMAWNIPEAVMRAREDQLPDWMKAVLHSGSDYYAPHSGDKAVTKDRYFPGISGQGGTIARGFAETHGLGAIPRAVNQTLYGKELSPSEQAQIDYLVSHDKLTEEQARKQYFGDQAKRAVPGYLGVNPVMYDPADPSTQGPPDPNAKPSKAAISAANVKGRNYQPGGLSALPFGETAPGNYDPKEAPDYGNTANRFFKKYGDPPASAAESQAYWDEHGQQWQNEVSHIPTRDTTAADQRKQAKATIDRVMAEYTDQEKTDPAKMVEAWQKIKEQQYAWGLPVTNEPGINGAGVAPQDRTGEDVRQALQDIKGGDPNDPRAGEAYIRERAADINAWVDAEQVRRRASDPKITKDKIRSEPQSWLNGLSPYEWQVKFDPTYDPMRYVDPGQVHQPGSVGPGGGQYAGIRAAAGLAQDTLTSQRADIWDKYYKDKVGDPKGAQAWLNAPIAPGGPSRADFANSVKPEQGLNLVGSPTKTSSTMPSPSPSTSGPVGASTSSSRPSASSAAPKSNSSVSTSRPATSAPRAASTPPKTATLPASTSGTKVTEVSPFQRWLQTEKPNLLPSSTSGASPKSSTGGSSAKDTAQAWTAWEGFYKEGKTSTAEAIPILEKHVAGGGDPGPYVRRAKYQVYEVIRNYQGPDKKTGNSQRGQWFAQVKALPDTVAGMKQLAAIEKLAKKK